jgi:hypothetical protein
MATGSGEAFGAVGRYHAAASAAFVGLALEDVAEAVTEQADAAATGPGASGAASRLAVGRRRDVLIFV